MRKFTWNRLPIKNLLIDSLLTPIVESTYLSGRGEKSLVSTACSKEDFDMMTPRSARLDLEGLCGSRASSVFTVTKMSLSHLVRCEKVWWPLLFIQSDFGLTTAKLAGGSIVPAPFLLLSLYFQNVWCWLTGHSYIIKEKSDVQCKFHPFICLTWTAFSVFNGYSVNAQWLKKSKKLI